MMHAYYGGAAAGLAPSWQRGRGGGKLPQHCCHDSQALERSLELHNGQAAASRQF